MKNKILIISITAVLLSCSKQEKTTQTAKQISKLKSDILVESVAYHALNQHPNRTLFISGKNLLKGTATYKITDEKGEELHCETFPATNLIQEEYKTANSTLQQQHLREVVEGYFME